MAERTAVNRWVEVDAARRVPVFYILGGNDVEFFDNPAAIGDALVAKYEELAKASGMASCVAVIESTYAPSPLIRLIYRLYKACRRHAGVLYVCGFPEDYLISLSTIALSEQDGFELRPSLESALLELDRGEA